MIKNTNNNKESIIQIPTNNSNQTLNNRTTTTINRNRFIKHKLIDLTKLTKSLNEVEDYLIVVSKNKLRESNSDRSRSTDDYVTQTSLNESSNCIQFFNDCYKDYLKKLESYSTPLNQTPSSTPTHKSSSSTTSSHTGIALNNNNNNNTTILAANGHTLKQQNNNSSSSTSSLLSQSKQMYRTSKTSRQQTDSFKKLRKLIPFYNGIKNHGNTCFINSIIQCIVHSEVLCLYFINRNKLMNDIKLITEQQQQQQRSFPLTKAFYYLLNSLWANSYEARLSIEFRNSCGLMNKDFSGPDQNDALEFCLWFLNTLSDELTLNKYDQVTREFKKFSFIDDTFKSKIKSILICSKCSYQSVKSETYMCLSLPIPQNRLKRSFYFSLILSNSISIYKNTLSPNEFRTLPSRLISNDSYSLAHVKIGLNIPVQGTIGDVKRLLAKNFFINQSNILLVELKSFGIDKTLSDCESTSVLSNDEICIIELNDLKLNNESIINIVCINIFKESSQQQQQQQQSSPNTFRSYLNDTNNQLKRRYRYGLPFVFSIRRDCSYTQLIDQIFTTQIAHLKENNYHKYRNHIERLIRILLVDTSYPNDESNCYPLSSYHEYPLYDQIVDRVIDEQSKNGGPKHVKLYIEWDCISNLNNFFKNIDISRPDYEHQSLNDVQKKAYENEAFTLNDCFSLFTQIEELNNENTWLCPQCKIQSNAKKKLCLSSLPEILILHLKRFYQTKNSNSKLITTVKFPQKNLDISKYIDDDLKQYLNDVNKTCTTYDLYAVSNHLGTLTNGHYTAYCKNPVDQYWYCYDDASVTQIDESQVCNENAYILFYKRRDSIDPLWWKEFVDEKLLNSEVLNYIIKSNNYENLNNEAEIITNYVQKAKSEESFGRFNDVPQIVHLNKVKLESSEDEYDQHKENRNQHYVNLPKQESSPRVNIVKSGILTIESENLSPENILNQNGIERQRSNNQHSDFLYLNKSIDDNKIVNDSESYLHDNNLIELESSTPVVYQLPIRSKSQPPKPQLRTQIPVTYYQPQTNYYNNLPNDFNRQIIINGATPPQQKHQFVNQPYHQTRRYEYDQPVPITFIQMNGTNVSAYNNYPTTNNRQGNRQNYGGPNVETTL